MRLYKLFALTFYVFLLNGCVVHIGEKGYLGNSMDAVFGEIRVAAGLSVGSLSNVNGGISIERDATVDNVDAVNGNISIAENVSVGNVNSVNGNIDIGENLTGRRSIESVNGNVVIGKQSVVTHSVTTVNGTIELNGVSVGFDVETLNGDIHIAAGSEIRGDIRIKRSRNSNRLFKSKHKPTLRIDQGVTLLGNIYLEKETELKITDPRIAEKVIGLE